MRSGRLRNEMPNGRFKRRTGSPTRAEYSILQSVVQKLKEKIEVLESGKGVLRFGDAVRVIIPNYEKQREYTLSGYITFIDDYFLHVRNFGVEWYFHANQDTFQEDKRNGPWYYEGSTLQVERIKHEEVSHEV